jgi:hypothetical protein
MTAHMLIEKSPRDARKYVHTEEEVFVCFHTYICTRAFHTDTHEIVGRY